MVAMIFNAVLNLIASLVKLFVLPLNLVITATLPDLSQKLIDVNSVLSSVFDNMSWGLGLIPTGILNTVVFILLIEIAKHTIYISTHALIKMWNIIQKIKFW